MTIDKWKHIAITFAIMSVINPLFNMFFGIIGTLYASALMVALIVGKELKDYIFGKTGFGKGDFAVSMISGFIYTIFWLIYYDYTHSV